MAITVNGYESIRFKVARHGIRTTDLH